MVELRKGSVALMFSAVALAAIIAIPTQKSATILSWLIYRICSFVDTLFHEMGHAVFGWLYGIPMVPMIFTVIGADQAGGMTMAIGGRTWLLQMLAIAGLGWFCYRLRKADSYYFFPTAAILLFILLTCLSGYHSEIISYMGHGGSILIGGFLLFKALANANMRHSAERWLNAFFGTYLLLDNFFFSYALLYNPEVRLRYIPHQAFGSTHNDFSRIAMNINGVTMDMIAIFTIGFCLAATAISCFLAYYLNREVKVKRIEIPKSDTPDW